MCSANCPPRVLARAQSAVVSLSSSLAGKTTCSPINQSHALAPALSEQRKTPDTIPRMIKRPLLARTGGNYRCSMDPWELYYHLSIIPAGFIAPSKRNCFSMSSFSVLLLSLPCGLENNGSDAFRARARRQVHDCWRLRCPHSA